FFLLHMSRPRLYTRSLHDALPIWRVVTTGARPEWTGARISVRCAWSIDSECSPRIGGRCSWQVPITGALWGRWCAGGRYGRPTRSEEHTSELQSRFDLVCRLLLEK